MDFFDYSGQCTFWADVTLLCVKMYRFFWAEIPEMVILF